jgi:DNA mismatch repair protein MutH
MYIPAPASAEELHRRAAWLAGRTLGEVAAALGESSPVGGVRGKGKVGTLLERALGASAGSRAAPDFPGLGIELKTIPVDRACVPLESTFVCTIGLASADTAEWATSVARAKLAHVLFVPVHVELGGAAWQRRIGQPRLWRPTPGQDATLRADFEEAMGLIGAGAIEELNARRGRWLQVRPKAATGRVRTVAFGPEGERIDTVPRGFYLRVSFTRALLADLCCEPG